MTSTGYAMSTGFADVPQDPLAVAEWWKFMRANEPVSWDKRFGSWHLFRYADITRVLADPGTYSSDLTGLIPQQHEFEQFTKGNFVRMDPPQHEKLRKLVSKAFTP